MRIESPERREPVIEVPKPVVRPDPPLVVRPGYTGDSAFDVDRPRDPTRIGAEPVPPAGPPASDDPKNQDVVRGLNRTERAKYDALPADQREQYNALSRAAEQQGPRAERETRQLLRDDQVDEYVAVSTAAGARAPRVQQLLFDGRLDDRSRGTTGDVLTQLAPLAQGGITQTGIDRRQLLGQLVDDIHSPESMRQGEGNRDCGAFAIAASAADRNPAAYARILTELAEKGQSTVRIGHETRTLEFEGATEAVDARRSVTQRIVAEAFGESVDDTPDNGLLGGVFDKVRSALDNINGMNAQEIAQRNAEASGGAETYGVQYVPSLEEAGGDAALRDRAMKDAEQQIREQAAAGQQPIVLLHPENGEGLGHWVVVTGVQQGDDGKSTVEFIDGSGAAQRMALDEFMGRSDSIVHNEAYGHATSAEFENQTWGGRGGDRGVKTDPPDGGARLTLTSRLDGQTPPP